MCVFHLLCVQARITEDSKHTFGRVLLNIHSPEKIYLVKAANNHKNHMLYLYNICIQLKIVEKFLLTRVFEPKALSDVLQTL
jgi:hypothetical protein